MRALAALLCSLCSFFVAIAPPPTVPDPLTDPVVWSTIEANGVAVALFASGNMEAAAIDAEGNLATSTTRDQGQNPAPVPVLTASWVDAAGVTHTVNTPMPSTTPAAMTNAIQVHETLVKRMQALHPPRPV